ncbi:MAG: hypothetical protein JW889_16790 [Verrucomicrobia bacterium]|nr:hypothetical protein [Verrucomicrobiota bacterium]
MNRTTLVFACTVVSVLVSLLVGNACQAQMENAQGSHFTLRLGGGTRDMDMELKSVSPAGTPLDPSLFDFDVKEETTAYFVNPGYSYKNFLDVRAILAWYDYEIDARSGTMPALDNAVMVDTQFAYGLGATVRYPIAGSFIASLDFNYVIGEFEDASLQFNPANPLFAAAEIGDIEWTELMISPMITYYLGNVAPYIGVRWSRTTAEVDMTITLPPAPPFTQTVEYKGADAWSGLIGTTFLFMEGRLQIDIVVEMFNNESIFGTVVYHF